MAPSHVTCIDLDPDSVATTRKTLGAHAPADAWTATQTSVFEHQGKHDVLYSWGVLHHAGDMWGAIDAAERMVKDGGIQAIAIYHKTALRWKFSELAGAAPQPADRTASAPDRHSRSAGERLLERLSPPVNGVAAVTLSDQQNYLHDVLRLGGARLRLVSQRQEGAEPVVGADDAKRRNLIGDEAAR